MYDKFCIIDMDYLMHVSYNWTSTANDSEEILATALNHELVAKFAKSLWNYIMGFILNNDKLVLWRDNNAGKNIRNFIRSDSLLDKWN